MRNLKRVLGLALASVMVLSMMVVGAGAANYDDFSDKDEIVNTEAVSVLVELGVIAGKADGSYDPTGIVTRAEMAKMPTPWATGLPRTSSTAPTWASWPATAPATSTPTPL